MKNTRPEIINGTQKYYQVVIDKTPGDYQKKLKKIGKDDVDKIIRAYWQYIMDELKVGNTVQTPIGIFKTIVRKPTKRFNIQKGFMYNVPAKVGLKLVPQSQFKKNLHSIPVDPTTNEANFDIL